MPLLFTCVAVVAAYLLGSIPFGYLAGRIAKIDIRQHGSGNIGATNVLRVLGRPWGYAVFTSDFFKGIAAVALVSLNNATVTAPTANSVRIFAGIAAVLGHAFPIWLNFRGGKAVATSLGVVCALAPLSALVVAVVWLLIFATSRYVSIASLGAAVMLPIATAVIQYRQHSLNWPLLMFFLALALLICVRHLNNIRRLRGGTEPRFSRR